jgi:hypothetical protein
VERRRCPRAVRLNGRGLAGRGRRATDPRRTRCDSPGTTLDTPLSNLSTKGVPAAVDRTTSARTSRPITILGAAPWRADLGGHAETPGVGGISDVSDLAWGAVTGICAWVSPATPAMLWALCLAGRRPNRRAVDPAPRERGTGYPGNPSSESNSELSSAGGWRRTRRPYAPPAGLASSCWQPTVFPPRPISAIVSLHESNVAKWRNRFREKGLEGQRRSAKWPTSSLRLYEGIGPAPVRQKHSPRAELRRLPARL